MQNASLNFQIATIVVFSFAAYLTIGMPLAVLPLHVSNQLHLGSLVAGLVISAQYLATFLSRTFAGRRVDTRGPKNAVVWGLFACLGSGISLTVAGLTTSLSATLAALFASRLLLGCGESFVATGAILWGIARVGGHHTARTISWNGVATYGALAVGAPLGVFLAKQFGFVSVGVGVALVAVLGLIWASVKEASPITAGETLPARHVFGQVWLYGLALALGSIGFATLATFITLYYENRHWPDAAWALTAFGAVFVGIRLLLADQIGRRGGKRVALFCFVVESAGLCLLGAASTPFWAFTGAVLSGAGFSLVFPALGVEAMNRVRADNRGAALALYTVFVDVALAVTGPLGGWLAAAFPMNRVFYSAALAAGGGFALTLALHGGKRLGSQP